jgi:hypothetical protein
MWKLILFITITIIVFGCAGLESANIVGAFDRTYRETKTFNTLDEVYSYQKQVIDTTTSLGGKVLTSDITIQSPPRYFFVVELPDYRIDFPYGERDASHKSATILSICMLILAGGAIVFLITIMIINYKRDPPSF